jgi:hypothetical protein
LASHSPVLIHYIAPHSKLYRKLQILVEQPFVPLKS